MVAVKSTMAEKYSGGGPTDGYVMQNDLVGPIDACRDGVAAVLGRDGLQFIGHDIPASKVTICHKLAATDLARDSYFATVASDLSVLSALQDLHLLFDWR